jgi:hypothetical protein
MSPLVHERTLARLLDDMASGNTPVADPRIDHHCELRIGQPEEIYGRRRAREALDE